MRTNGCARRVLVGFVLAGLLGGGAGCDQSQRRLVTYPRGTLPIHYEAASVPTACLVAGVAMAANYLVGERKFTEPQIRAALARQNLDEKKVADLKTFLETQGLELVVLAGRMDGEPPLGLRYWLLSRGYPVICVINRQGADPDVSRPVDPQFNHAVVVTGFSANPADPAADILYYLDPSTADPLQSVGLAEFDAMWARCDRAMMLVVQPPEPAPRAGN